MSDLEAPGSPDPSMDEESEEEEGPASPDQSSALSEGETTEFDPDSSVTDVNVTLYNTPSATSPHRHTGL